MLLDKAVIPHYTVDTIPFKKLKGLVDVNDVYLQEKDTWYKVENKLQYFKVRKDLRLFSEIFFQEFASESLDLDTLKYRLAYLRRRKEGELEEKPILGLLSESFQHSDSNYYLVSELCNSMISDYKQYGDYSLKTLLHFFKDTIAEKDYLIIKKFLIKLFIADAYTMQLDRNPHNIGFEIPAIKGLSHLKRLRSNLIEKHLKNTSGILEVSDFSQKKILGLKPSKVYDNERILGIDHRFVFVNKPGDTWTPVFPFSPELYFGPNGNHSKNVGKKVSDEQYGGLDPNLAELHMEYTEESKDDIDKLARDDYYRKIIETFCKPNSPICLSPKQEKLILEILDSRRKEFNKILTLSR